MKFIPPIPSIDPKMIPLIVEAGKKAWQLIESWIDKKIKTVSEKQPLTKESSASDFQEVQKLFTELQQQVGSTVQELEKKVALEINEYLEQLVFLLTSNSILKGKYHIPTSKYEREIRRISKQCNGFIEQEIATSINLMNPEVHQILMMLPGQKKEIALNNLITRVIEKSLNNFADFFQEEVSYLSSIIEEDLLEQITQLKRVDEDLLKQLILLEGTYKEGNIKNEHLQLDAYKKLESMKKIEYIFE
ncbi:hypothetical protein [Lysinibacillus sp. K60]|uniref:hypothetical protein n=1 Tax=Lysinibacillus sp. K60 TaxID=2720027 RepID=UPI001C8CAA87|nr:hypothetical protein [Lysinibacillus sp. K60]MBX8946781.1 hypothetical protein [Lysinibacillus sp. K60]